MVFSGGLAMPPPPLPFALSPQRRRPPDPLRRLPQAPLGLAGGFFRADAAMAPEIRRSQPSSSLSWRCCFQTLFGMGGGGVDATDFDADLRPLPSAPLRK